jgi:hypothetical protein
MPKDQIHRKCQSGSFKWPIRAVGRMETTGKKPDIGAKSAKVAAGLNEKTQNVVMVSHFTN